MVRDTDSLRSTMQEAEAAWNSRHDGRSKMNFEIAFERLIGNERGYSNNPLDPGKETNWGISKRSYPDVDIASLTRDQAKQIYRSDFWNKGSFDQLPFALAFQAFDIAVNSGITEAVKLLQQAAGVVVDGDLGPKTLAAINSQSLPALLMLLAAARLDFWRSLPIWETFGNGWAGRASDNLRFAAKDIYR